MAIKKGRISRIQSLGGLAAQLAGGAIASVTDRLISGRDTALDAFHKKTAEKLLQTFGDMKGLPMKVGQILSYMDGVIPIEYQDLYRKTLSALQVRMKPYSWEEIQSTFLQEFGKEPEVIFAQFDRIPIAAASIGQVYLGHLRDGRKVAVKIQYPEIGDAVSSDLRNVEAIVKTFRTLLPNIDNEQLSQDLLARFRDELDYLKEAEHQFQFHRCWKDHPNIIIPVPIQELCRRRVLVTEYHVGKNFSEIASAPDPSVKSSYGETLFWFAYHSILSYGLFNADPHPGNFLFQPEGRIVFLDFGCVQGRKFFLS